MPTYEFHCKKCGAEFTLREHISAFGARQTTCPKCKSTDVERRLSHFYARTPRKS
jgi:putative FmdB family regulatory protein